MRRVCLTQKNIRKYASRYHVKRVGSKCWGQDIAVKMAKWSSEEFQKVSEVSCEYLSDSFLLCLTLFWCNVTLFLSSLCSTINHAWIAPAPFRLSHDLFHMSIASWSDPAPFRPSHTHDLSIAFWSDQFHVASSLGTRPQKLRPLN